MRLSPKILGPNVGMFGTDFGRSRTVFEIGFGLETMSSSFVVCFGVWGCLWPELEVVKWTEPRLV